MDLGVNISPFAKSVYLSTQKIPHGKLSTYKLIAQAIGSPNACQAIGMALSKNPFAPYVPCHRVVNTDGWISGFYGDARPGSLLINRKIRLLKDEGIEVDNNGYILNFKDKIYDFKN